MKIIEYGAFKSTIFYYSKPLYQNDMKLRFFLLFSYFYKRIVFILLFLTAIWLVLRLKNLFLVAFFSIIIDFIDKILFKKYFFYFYLNNQISIYKLYALSLIVNIVFIKIISLLYA